MAETVVGSLELDGFPLGEIEATVEHGRISFDYGTGEAWRGQSYTLRTAGGRTIEFVADCNLHRRDLTPSQKACIAAEIKKRLEAVYAERRKAGKKLPTDLQAKLPEGRQSRDEAAAKVGVSPRYVTDAEHIQREAPEVFEDVRAGRLGY